MTYADERSRAADHRSLLTRALHIESETTLTLGREKDLEQRIELGEAAREQATQIKKFHLRCTLFKRSGAYCTMRKRI